METRIPTETSGDGEALADERFHPLPEAEGMDEPDRFTFPLCYEPHPMAVAAAHDLQRWLARRDDWREELETGKMLGVLVVEHRGRRGYLAAFSGLLGGRADCPPFVPPVYDLTQPDGHFRRQEAAISQINAAIQAAESDPERLFLVDEVRRVDARSEADLAARRRLMREAKARRDALRARLAGANGGEDGASQEALVRQSQQQKAEFHRLKQAYKAEREALVEHLQATDQRIAQLKGERREQSDRLQTWLFRQFRLRNARGEECDLVELFTATATGRPPSGSGECCAPRLLQYAYLHAMRPLAMAEFWWGRSPAGEVRHHLHYYPACSSRCKPILAFMLQGLEVDPDPMAALRPSGTLTVVYEDDALAVVVKPAGMLSVPGRDERPSVLRLMQERWGLAEMPGLPLVVHRLDMDTSGLMVVARTPQAFRHLQAQFLRREVRKEYRAVLLHGAWAAAGQAKSPELRKDGPLTSGDCGVVSLPLAPDLADRPRQRVDHKRGKQAVTDYEVVYVQGPYAEVLLRPRTGRTHQLRLHCASDEGLGMPIVGDRLYGRQDVATSVSPTALSPSYPAVRLYLHAERLAFTHPVTGRPMTFHNPAPWPPLKNIPPASRSIMNFLD